MAIYDPYMAMYGLVPCEGAQKKFVEIGEAYEVLNDKKTRAKYDKCGESCLKDEGPRPGGFQQHFNLFEMLFGQFFGGGFGGFGGGFGPGEHAQKPTH